LKKAALNIYKETSTGEGRLGVGQKLDNHKFEKRAPRGRGHEGATFPLHARHTRGRFSKTGGRGRNWGVKKKKKKQGENVK